MMSRFVELIQISLGNREHFTVKPTDEEWEELFNTCMEQALMGVGFEGIQRLSVEEKPPFQLLIDWVNYIHKIEDKNRRTNMCCVGVSQRFAKDGYSTCVIKGQGNSLLYPNPMSRNSGDVDIWVVKDLEKSIGRSDVGNWVDENRRDVIGYVGKIVDTIEARVHHVEFPVKSDITIEVHYLPMFMYSIPAQRKFEAFCHSHLKDIFYNKVKLPNCGDDEIAVPDQVFNSVFQMVHVLRHLFEEGIGMRQLVDYYYVLCRLYEDTRGERNAYIIQWVRELGMEKFATALMWVMSDVLGMDERMLLCVPDEKRGKLLYEEVMAAGNFGFFDKSKGEWMRKGVLFMFIWKIKRNSRYWSLCPQEVVWGPIFRIWHYCWRKKNGYIPG